MGATLAVDVRSQTLAEVQKQLGMKEGFDVGLEMSGNPAAFRDMLANMCHGGKIAMLGIPEKEIAIDWNIVIFNMLTIKGIYGREMYETWYKMTVMLQIGPGHRPDHHAPVPVPGVPEGLRRHARRALRQGGADVVRGVMSDQLVVLFEDNHCLAVAKPAGLLTQGVPPGIPTLEAQAKDYLKTRYGKAGNVYLGIPHRLDRPVSGVVLFARSSKAARRLAEQFRERTVRKVYLALVEADARGGLPPAEGVWEDWLLKVKEESRTEIVTPQTPGARQALLRFHRLEARADAALLEIEPETGRMHQIRVQASARGWPILGDAAYGSKRPFGPPVELARDRVIALHAGSLTFLHPIRYEPLTVTAPLPAAWGGEIR